MAMGATRARMLVPLLLGAMLPLSVLAQASGDVVVVSDTQTQWLNEDTNLWQPAVITTLQSPLWPQIDGAEWIWNYPIATPDQKENGDVVQFRRTFTLPAALDGTGTFLVTADNEVTARLNGQEIITTICDFNHSATCLQDIPITGQAGENVFEFTVTQYGRAGSSSTPNRNLAGLVYQATFATPAAPEPIVLVPGMLVSQNKKLLYEDKEGGPWKMVFGGNVYKGLITKLEQAGFVQGENLFIAHYDWRQPVTTSAQHYLVPTITQAKQLTGAEKVDVIAHSMGGLLARAYIQSDSYANDIDQLITLGTPHQGTADAYVAWEGGKFPVNWDSGTRARVFAVERALKKTRKLHDIQRPLSFRAFFPSLKDLLPTANFARKNDQTIPVADLTEHNDALAALNSTIDEITGKAVEFHTMAGRIETTLHKIALTNARSPEDKALQRWRDGAPNPDPPLPDSTEGDNRVLITSANISTNAITFSNTSHTGLPDSAQNQIIGILGLEETVEQYTSDPEPRSIFSLVILSPLEAVIEGPNGKTLSKDHNDFGGDVAEYDDDPNDPDDPQEITILNPPEGQYTVTLTGTGDGAYTVITCYADADEDACITREGETRPGLVETFTAGITLDSFEPPVDDVVDLICQLPDTIKRLMFDRHLKPRAFMLHGTASRLCSFAQNWQRETDREKPDTKQVKRWKGKTQMDFNRFTHEFAQQIKAGNVDEEGILEIVNLRDQINQIF